jgi:hypothetical protein
MYTCAQEFKGKYSAEQDPGMNCRVLKSIKCKDSVDVTYLSNIHKQNAAPIYEVTDPHVT